MALDPEAWDAFSRGSAIRRAVLEDPEPLVQVHAASALERFDESGPVLGPVTDDP